jgi:predicted CopG family antitoxin
MSVRTTISIDEELHRLLKLKALESSRSVSDLINEIARDAFREDLEDLKTIEERRGEGTVGFEELLAELEAEGRL